MGDRHLLKDRRALVAGSAGGIGAALARALAAAGAHVEGADLEGEPPCDITRGADVDALFARLHQAGKLPDLLVLAAGVGVHERLAEGDPARWARVLETNVLGPLRLVRAFVPPMLAAGRGDVVFLSSVAARAPYAYGGVYSASKAALDAAAEALRLEVQPRVRVLVVRPGAVDTAFFERASGHPGLDALGWAPLAADEVADAVVDALARPPTAVVNEITVRPASQPF